MVPGVSVALGVTALHKRYGRIEALAGVAPSFEGDPVGCDVPEGLREVEIAAVEAATP